MKGVELTKQEFIATVLDNEPEENLDSKMQGRYRVHIPDLMPHPGQNTGIWVKNHVHKYRITSSKYGEYGQYFPLQPYTKVVVKFFENDFNTGYIDRIISDYRSGTDVEGQDCTKTKPAMSDRDEQYILLKTPKFWNEIYINEGTKNEQNTMYVYVFNRDKESPYTDRDVEGERNRRTVYRVDETGIHIWTHDNLRYRIHMDENRQIDGDHTLYIEGYSTTHVDKDRDLHIHKNSRYHVDENEDRTIDKDRTTNIGKNDHMTIGTNRVEEVGSNQDEKIGSNFTLTIGSNKDEKVGANSTLQVSGIYNISVSGPCNINSGASVNVDAPKINLNCALAPFIPATQASPPIEPDDCKGNTTVRDLGPRETSEYDLSDGDEKERPRVVGKKCDEATEDYNINFRETLTDELYEGD